MLVNRDCRDTAKKKYYQSLQEALREATWGDRVQKPEFESGFFLSLPPESRGDFETVWRKLTMEQGWID